MGASVGIGMIGGGLMQGFFGQQAAGQQAAAGGQAMGILQGMLGQEQAMMQPFMGAGLQGLQQLQQGLAPGGNLTQQYALQQAAQQGMLGATPFQAQTSPAQQFATSQALDAMRNQMQVGGQALSSNAISGAGQLAGNIGGQFEQQAFNQWLQGRQQILGENQMQLGNAFGLAGLGQGAAGQLMGAMGQTAQGLGQTAMGIGNARSAGTMAMGQGLGSILGGLGMMGGAGMFGGGGGVPTPGGSSYMSPAQISAGQQWGMY